jgi:hypothetical protein
MRRECAIGHRGDTWLLPGEPLVIDQYRVENLVLVVRLEDLREEGLPAEVLAVAPLVVAVLRQPVAFVAPAMVRKVSQRV